MAAGHVDFVSLVLGWKAVVPLPVVQQPTTDVPVRRSAGTSDVLVRRPAGAAQTPVRRVSESPETIRRW